MARGSFLGPAVDERHPYANKRARIAIVRSRRGQWHDHRHTCSERHALLARLFWRLKSRHRRRPRIPADVQRLIAEMAMKNRTWGEERIAAEALPGQYLCSAET